MPLIIGIDNGLDGGLVALSDTPGAAPVAMTAMPTHRVSGTREVAIAALIEWLRALNWPPQDRPLFVLEECPQHASSACAMRSMALTAGMLIGAIAARFPQCRLIRVKSGNSKESWQRAILGKVPQGETKQYALAQAKRIWPAEKWLASPKCSKPHDGMVDASLIAYFILTKGGKL